jgi:hypothetical protein
MSIPEFTSTAVPESILKARAIPIERAGSAKEVADRIRQGKAFLKIVSTPWGVDFYICEVGDE